MLNNEQSNQNPNSNYKHFTYSCGYKPLNYNSNFKIGDIQSSGDSKINFILKNKINRNHFNDDAINIIKLEINSNKIKL